uniref:Uncharacterized protein n=1 Tax=Solanum lycopersicum TaxID=4081 RepID=K4B5Z8_SOLLC
MQGRLMSCMASPCYAVRRLQRHSSDVCEATEAKAGHYAIFGHFEAFTERSEVLLSYS